MENYNLVYDYFENASTFENTGFIISCTIVAFIIYAIVKDVQYKIGILVFLVVSFLFSLMYNVLGFRTYEKIEQRFEDDNFRTVVGVVSEYLPRIPEEKGSMETFLIDSVAFSFSDNMKTEGYNTTCNEGGLVCGNGQQLKIEYISTFSLLIENDTSNFMGTVLGNQIIKIYQKE